MDSAKDIVMDGDASASDWAVDSDSQGPSALMCDECHNELSECDCQHCDECGTILPRHYCSTCQRLDAGPYRGWNDPFDWERCRLCAETEMNCKCPGCLLCSNSASRCSCSNPRIRRYLVKTPRIGHIIDTITLPNNCRQGNDDDTIILKGDMSDLCVVVIRRPSAVWRSIRDKLRNIAVGCMTSIYKLCITSIRLHLEPAVEASHINVTSMKRLDLMLQNLAALPRGTKEPVIAFDMEGNGLGRNAEPCYLQIRDCVKAQTYLIDLYTLRRNHKAFTTPGPDGRTTLKGILEDQEILKIIFDCRQDSDALFWRCGGIKLAGVMDLQYIYMLGHGSNGRRPGLASILAGAAQLTGDERSEWQVAKNISIKYSDFMLRPLPVHLKTYSVNDVRYLQRMYEHESVRLSEYGLKFATEWTTKEIEETWREDWVSSRSYTSPNFPEYVDPRVLREDLKADGWSENGRSEETGW